MQIYKIKTTLPNNFIHLQKLKTCISLSLSVSPVSINCICLKVILFTYLTGTRAIPSPILLRSRSKKYGRGYCEGRCQVLTVTVLHGRLKRLFCHFEKCVYFCNRWRDIAP